MQERHDETGVGVTIEVAVQRERWWRIERDNDDGDDDDGEQTTKNQFQIYFPPTPDQKRHHNLFHMRPGSKRLSYWRHGKHVVTEMKRAWSIKYGDTRYIGGLGPCSLYLIFSSDLVKIYLVDPYTVGKISASSFSGYEKLLMLVPFLESY